jgi:O-antigen/teichoic acid export membrane protein
MPENIYYCLSGQITIWLISIFGNTTSVAELGALGRLSLALNVFTIVLSTVVIPRYAKLTVNKNLLLKRQMQIFACMIAVCVFIIVVTWLIPHQILAILGNNYKTLNVHLLFLAIYGSCLNLLVSCIYLMYTSRGWIINPILSISISIISTLVAFFLFDMSTIKGVLFLNIFLSSVQLIFQGSYSVKKSINAQPNF